MATENETLPSADPFKLLQITLNPDGTLTRHINLGKTSPNPDNSNIAVLSKDITINPSNKTWVRIFLPIPKPSTRLPVFLYFHGGGFIIGSPDDTAFHEFCSTMATELHVIIVSASYRLGPEHRLPAAYDDAMEALYWIKTSNEIWLENYADFSNVFVMGISAGGNVAFQLGLRAAEQVDDLLPLKIKGLILHHPFIGGVERTESELRSDAPLFLPCVSDLIWELSLPVGVDRDHEYCNPMVGSSKSSSAFEKIKRLGWRVFVAGCHGDQLIDRQIELVKIMEEAEIQVVSRFVGGSHGLELFDHSKAKELFVALKDFMLSSI
ncbi:Alpha/beta hydrolase-3 [Corchorus capsularis]|uniref:Alpha/beta hydrolase-3 n=1 Tax=Corchorus capsularis TaxID=210143 RepID=A0A1R3FYU5_COCAP|nr:Alpha/beta hydrolase-3 [Corchorus capsularis]